MTVNLIIDGSFILHKNVFTLDKMNTLYGDFHKALTNNITKYTSLFRCRVFIVFDSRMKSWRKEIYPEYKGKRKPAKDIDWEWVYEQLGIWIDAVKAEGQWVVLQEDRIEGDDWIMTLVRAGNKRNESNVVIASDGDLKQLLGFKGNQWINIQIADIHRSEVVYLPEGYDIYLNQLITNANDDPFNLIRRDMEWGDQLNSLLRDFQFKEVNTNQHMFCKIVHGDTGDNIGSVYTKVIKGGKLQGIGEAGALAMWKIYIQDHDEKIDTKDPALPEAIIECIEIKNKVQLTDEVKDGVREKIARNIRLMELHWRHYPEHILETMIQDVSECRV